jgi:crotonobetainyl-CoA:carnitine CoA-transferase CaiB-like acyl-CoA transferase
MSVADNVAKTADLPLAGVRVVDLTQVMMGPVCTQMLADYGADVIKVERKGAGDLSRSTFEPVAGADNPIFCSLNRNKRSVALDLRDAQQLADLKALIADADVVVSNFRAGVMDRMGVGYEDCRRLNPRIIYAVGTGFGETGPYAHKGGQDVLAQAMSGVMARRADESLPISVYPTALADYSAGMHMVQGILLALLHRERTGEGQKVNVSLYNSMLAMQMQEAAMIMMADSEVNWAAMPLSGVFDTQDGALVLVGAFKANPLRDICTALQIEDLSVDPRFCNLNQQFAHKAELQRTFRERFASNTRDFWLARLEEQDLLCAPVRDLREALVDPQTLHNQLILEGEGERAFCVGADLKNPSVSGLDYWGAPRPGGFGGIALRETLNVPVIARVNGYALGGGFEMVLGCDLVVACDEASFGLPEALVGRMPLDGGMTLLQRQIPYRQAMAMLMTGRRVSAREALDMGLVNEVVPRAELDTAVERWVQALLACAPLSLQAIKQVVKRTSTLSPADAQALRLPALVAALQSEDANEGVRAFQEKRKPVWSGR